MAGVTSISVASPLRDREPETVTRRPAGVTALQNVPSWVLLSPASVLLIAWSLAVPIFEGPDEPAHWQYARYFRAHLQPPPFTEDYIEADQLAPPLCARCRPGLFGGCPSASDVA